MQRRLQPHGAGRGLAGGDAGAEQCCRLASDLGAGLLNQGETRLEAIGPFEIVEADQRQIARDRKTFFANGADCPDGRHVVAGDQCGGRCRQR